MDSNPELTCIPKSRRTSKEENKTFIVQELNWSAENQNPYFGALLHFQYHSSEEIVYISKDSNPELTQYNLSTEVTANQQRGKRNFHCSRIDY